MKTLRQLFFFAATLGALVIAGNAWAQKAAQAGVDYQIIAHGQTFSDNRGKIEVAEVFSYRCPHCAMFQPISDGWRKRLGDDVHYVHVPATFDPRDMFARAHFAAQKTGVIASSHGALFRAIHSERNFPGNPSADELVAFHVRQGANQASFVAAMNSPETAALMQKSREFIEANGVMGTPTLIINGQYRVTGRSHQDNIRIAEQLIAQLRAQHRRTP
ncbi:hypothetical protein CO611_00710 [Lysobacteraceae bacterium NML03-0222]|nr:hypothetical protein CO611_00710 [Xanthomonadaceae bacterium NML03-0222]